MAEPDEERTFSRSVIHLPLGLPFEITLRLPFSQNRIVFGKNSLDRLRRQVASNPSAVDAHVTLAAQLLSEEPVLPLHAAEAIKHLSIALHLMPPDAEDDSSLQQKAMVHDFLGDAWIAAGRREDAHRHWELAIALDPVAPPDGFAGRAQQMLEKYPLDDPMR